MQIKLYQNDLPSDILQSEIQSVAIDTEAMGLMPYRDRLCLAQFVFPKVSTCYIVQFTQYNQSPNIKSLLSNSKIMKIFHFARFDITMFYRYLNIMTINIYCTKIASKLARTYTDRHSLKDLCLELLHIDLPKTETCTDWGNDQLTQEQLEYAAEDVTYLHVLKEKLDIMLNRENKIDIAKACFDFLPTRILFDLTIGQNYDIFAHH